MTLTEIQLARIVLLLHNINAIRVTHLVLNASLVNQVNQDVTLTKQKHVIIVQLPNYTNVISLILQIQNAMSALESSQDVTYIPRFVHHVSHHYHINVTERIHLIQYAESVIPLNQDVT